MGWLTRKVFGKKKGVIEDGVDESKLFEDRVLVNPKMAWLDGTKARRIATVLLYERIGKTEKFLGAFPLLKGKIDIGEHCVLDYKKGFYMDVPDSKDLVPCDNMKISKMVEVVKFSEDDLRYRGRINDTFYRKVKKPVYEAQPVLDEESGDPILDENKLPVVENVQKLEDGVPVFEDEEEDYVEPKGVSIEGRDAIRIHNNTAQQIKEFRDKNKSWLEKYGTIVVPIVGMAIVAFLFLMGMKYLSETYIGVAGEVSDTIEANQVWWSDKDFIDKVADKTNQKLDEKNAPPSS